MAPTSGLSCCALRMVVAGTFKTCLYTTQGHKIWADCNLHVHCHENVKSQSVLVPTIGGYMYLTYFKGRLDSALER